ncbi:mCG1027692 [Mus musculus]|nr:mCG1027692 [Mus musculus]
MKDSLLMTHMYWSALHCNCISIYLLGLHNFWCSAVVSCLVCGLGLFGRVMSAETDSCVEARQVEVV